MTHALRERRSSAGPRRNQDGRGSHSRNLALLWAGQFVNTAGLMMLVPIMPFYLQRLGMSGTVQIQTWAGIAIAAPALTLTVATPLWGKLGDRIGRKWMVVRALLGLAVAMVVMATASTPLVLVLGRLLQGALGGVVEAASAFAGSVGSSSKRGSSLGKSFSATAAGALAGPIIGGLLVGGGGLSTLMFAVAAAAVLLAFGCAAGLHEPARDSDEGASKAPQRGGERPSVMRVPGAVPLALAAVAAYLGVYGLIPLFAEHVSGIVSDPGAASLWVGTLYSVMWGATLLGSFWWGKHNDRTNRPLRTFALAAGGCAASIAAIAVPLGPLALIPLRFVQGFAFAALAQSLFLHFSNHAPDGRKSAYVGTANSFLLIGQSAGPLLAGPLISIMPVTATILVMAASCALSCLLAFTGSRIDKPPHSDGHPSEEHPPSPEQADTSSEEETAPVPTITTTPNPDHVDVAPFRGWHLAAHRLHDLGARYSTPWGRESEHAEQPDSEVAHVFAAWQRSGTLTRDKRASFYAYRQTGPRGRQEGLLAAVHLDSTLLPHEDVVPARVNGITRLSHTANMNLDPLLLGYSGDGRTGQHLTETMQRPPTSTVSTSDGQRHQLWRLPPEAHTDVVDELSTAAAFIADGHHRHVAARHLRRQLYADGHGPGPWDLIPGLLVDVRAHPLSVGPVHRVLPSVEPRHALAEAAARFRVAPLRGELEHWLATLEQHARYGPAFVLVTADDAWLLTEPHRGALISTLAHLPEPLRNLPAAVLHAGLIEPSWELPATSPDIHYHPNASAAVRQAKYGGVAVLVSAPSHTDLATVTSAGLRLPPKTTSFGPRPHPGLVFRSFDEE